MTKYAKTKCLPFIERELTAQEVLLINLSFSLFTNGFGSEQEKGGETRIGWRQMERVFADLFAGKANENKDVFDVVVPIDRKTDVGLSIKSKNFSSKQFTALGSEGRVYMELTNSPAKLWASLNRKGLVASDFQNKNKAADIGNAVLDTVESWHQEAKTNYPHYSQGKVIDLSKSVYISVSMTDPTDKNDRQYVVHSFPLNLPKPIRWEKYTHKCLRGFDPDHPNQALYDWYPNSGGQLKYYPRAEDAKFSSGIFESLKAPKISMVKLAQQYWPQIRLKKKDINQLFC